MSIISKETAVANEIDEVVTELENKGVIKRAHSPYNSPVWPIKKTLTRQRRFVADYWQLNTNTAPAAVPNAAERVQHHLLTLLRNPQFTSDTRFWKTSLMKSCQSPRVILKYVQSGWHL